MSSSGTQDVHCFVGGLRHLDLGSLPSSEEGPQSELQARRTKFAQFEHVCSQVTPGVYLGGEYVATHQDVLEEAGITHVVNCVGQLYSNLFQDLKYYTLRLNGARPSCQDICMIEGQTCIPTEHATALCQVLSCLAVRCDPFGHVKRKHACVSNMRLHLVIASWLSQWPAALQCPHAA